MKVTPRLGHIETWYLYKLKITHSDVRIPSHSAKLGDSYIPYKIYSYE